MLLMIDLLNSHGSLTRELHQALELDQQLTHPGMIKAYLHLRLIYFIFSKFFRILSGKYIYLEASYPAKLGDKVKFNCKNNKDKDMNN